MPTALLHRDDATLLADSGHEILSDTCPTCQGTGEHQGVSCPTCCGTAAVYWVARYSDALRRIERELGR